MAMFRELANHAAGSDSFLPEALAAAIIAVSSTVRDPNRQTPS